MDFQLTKYFEFVWAKSQKEFFKLYQLPLAEILMIHRVAKKNQSNISVFEDLIISPEYLEATIVSYLKDGYFFISINELYELLINKKDFNKEKLIILTIDDGYKDTYDTAYPILKKYKIPFTFYVSSAFPNKEIGLWWNYLNDLVLENSEIRLVNGQVLTCNTIQEKEKCYIFLSKKILEMGNNLAVRLPELLDSSFQHIVEKYQYLLIDWEQIIEMNQNILCTIGAHTYGHFGLRFSNEEIVKADIKKNKDELESILSTSIEHFAFPYGTHYSVGNREYRLARQAGFKTAVVTLSSPIYKYHVNKLHSLPRINLVE